MVWARHVGDRPRGARSRWRHCHGSILQHRTHWRDHRLHRRRGALHQAWHCLADEAQRRRCPDCGCGYARARARVSPIFAVLVLAVSAGLGWWAWYELIRSPYLSHGYMTLEMQFKLPAGMALPDDASNVHIAVFEGRQMT